MTIYFTDLIDINKKETTKCKIHVHDEKKFIKKILPYQKKLTLYGYIFSNNNVYITFASPNYHYFIEKVNMNILEILKHAIDNNIKTKINLIQNYLKNNGYTFDNKITEDFTKKLYYDHDLNNQMGGKLWGSVKDTTFINIVDLFLIILGAIPIVGIVFDAASAVLAFLRGSKIDLVAAILGVLLSLIPVVGDILGVAERIMGKALIFATRGTKLRKMKKRNKINDSS
jgi:hypothetical protein